MFVVLHASLRKGSVLSGHQIIGPIMSLKSLQLWTIYVGHRLVLIQKDVIPAVLVRERCYCTNLSVFFFKSSKTLLNYHIFYKSFHRNLKRSHFCFTDWTTLFVFLACSQERLNDRVQKKMQRIEFQLAPPSSPPPPQITLKAGSHLFWGSVMSNIFTT